MNPQIDARYDNGVTGHKRLDGPLKLGGSAFWGPRKNPAGHSTGGVWIRPLQLGRGSEVVLHTQNGTAFAQVLVVKRAGVNAGLSIGSVVRQRSGQAFTEVLGNGQRHIVV